MLNIAICDDDVAFLNKVYNYVLGVCFNKNEEIKVDLCNDSNEFFEEVSDRKCRYDMVFMDVHFGGHNGVEIAKIIRSYNLDCEIIFVSKDPNYVFKSFETKPFDYLVKPLSKDVVKNVITRFDFYHNAATEEYFSFKVGKEEERVRLKSIYYFFSTGRKITLVADEDEFEFYQKLDDVEAILAENSFIRIHQSYLVNPLHINFLAKDNVVMENGEYLRVSRGKYKEAHEKYLDFMR